MRIVATGATSFVGAGTVRELLRRGHEVCAVLREHSAKADRLKENGVFPEGLTVLQVDLGELSRLTEWIEEPCDVFLHMGWRGAGSGDRGKEEIQKESVRDALGAVRIASVLGCKRFLFTGSQAEYGVHDCLTNEQTPCRPTSFYGEAKLAVRREAEELCRLYSMDYGHIRIFSVYGPGDHPWSLVSTCLDTFLKGGRMELSACTQQWNFLYIDDAAQAIADLAEFNGTLSDFGCVYNLAGPMDETGPLRGFVEQMYELCGRRGGMQYGLRPPNAEGAVNLIPDIRKIRNVTGWEPKIRFEQGIRNMLRKL